MLWDGQRPDMIVIDDLMNEELVANKDRRDKLRRWVYGSLIPCRSEKGIIRFVGTPMNLDDPLEALMPRENARDTIVEDLKIWSKKKKGMWRANKLSILENKLIKKINTDDDITSDALLSSNTKKALENNSKNVYSPKLGAKIQNGVVNYIIGRVIDKAFSSMDLADRAESKKLDITVS